MGNWLLEAWDVDALDSKPNLSNCSLVTVRSFTALSKDVWNFGLTRVSLTTFSAPQSSNFWVHKPSWPTTFLASSCWQCLKDELIRCCMKGSCDLSTLFKVLLWLGILFSLETPPEGYQIKAFYQTRFYVSFFFTHWPLVSLILSLLLLLTTIRVHENLCPIVRDR